MKKALLLLAVVAGVGMIGWVAYATSGVQAVTTAGKNAPAPVCDPATEDCPSATSCHDGKTTCPPSCKDCPDFKDSDGDGVCDVVADCGRHGQSGCRSGFGHCGGHAGRDHGCRDGR